MRGISRVTQVTHIWGNSTELNPIPVFKKESATFKPLTVQISRYLFPLANWHCASLSSTCKRVVEGVTIPFWAHTDYPLFWITRKCISSNKPLSSRQGHFLLLKCRTQFDRTNRRRALVQRNLLFSFGRTSDKRKKKLELAFRV